MRNPRGERRGATRVIYAMDITENTHPWHLQSQAMVRRARKCVQCLDETHLRTECPEKPRCEKDRRCLRCHDLGHRPFDCLKSPTDLTEAWSGWKDFIKDATDERIKERTRMLYAGGHFAEYPLGPPCPAQRDLGSRSPGGMEFLRPAGARTGSWDAEPGRMEGGAGSERGSV